MDYTKLEDNKLIDLIRTHNENGFDALRLRYKSAITRHINSIIHNSESAEDLLQETFLKVWTKSEQWDGRGSVKAWLYRIATNLALNTLRSPKHQRETTLEILDSEMDSSFQDDSPDPESIFEQAQRMDSVRRLVSELSDEKRELIYLVYEADMEIKKAAEIMGIPEGTAKSRLFYSTKYLARKWRSEDNE